MKIVLVGPAYPLRGGNALFVAHLYDALKENNEVTVISFSRLYPGFLFPGVRQVDVSGVAMKQHPAQSIIDCLNPFTWFAAARAAATINPDLLVFTWWNPFFGPIVKTIASAYRRKTGKPVVIIAENVVSHESRWIDLYLTMMALRQADRFLVLSSVVENDIRKLFPSSKVFRSSLPVYDCYRVGQSLTQNQAKEKLGLGGKNVILFFGYVRRYKGLMNLLEAFPLIKERVENAHLLVVGEYYDDPNPYHDAVQRRGFQANVTEVAEYVANEDVHLYFEAANVAVLPYNGATQSGILSIAYGFSKPVIVTDVGGLAELVDDGKTGFIVPPHDNTMLAEAVIRYFQEGREAEFSSNIVEKREKNSFNRIREVFEEIRNDLNRP
jgi:glycosyltransferase involved in cell wall biosynthesis